MLSSLPLESIYLVIFINDSQLTFLNIFFKGNKIKKKNKEQPKFVKGKEGKWLVLVMT